MRVTKELAIKLKEKRFDVPCDFYYGSKSDRENYDQYWANSNHNDKDRRDAISAPDLHTVTDWLREKGMHVCALPALSLPSGWDYVIIDLNERKRLNVIGMPYDTHDLALLHGVTAAVEMV